MKHRHKLHIKHLIENTHSVQEIENLCSIIVKELKDIRCTIYTLDSVDLWMGSITNLITGFKNVIEICETPDDWDELGYSGNFTKLFNEYLKGLYELANEEVSENGIKYKFILIN